VTYVNYADAFISEPSDQSEQSLDIVALKAAGGFVHQYDAGSRGDCATYLDHLLRSDRKSPNSAIRMNLGVVKAV
jgi:hypothetical protein